MASQPETGAVPDGQPQGGLPGPGDPREPNGRLVREIWVAWAREQPNPRPSWLLAWEDLSDGEREVDMRIGSAVAAKARIDVGLGKLISDLTGARLKLEAIADLTGGRSLIATELVRDIIAADPLAFSPAYRLITDTGGIRHLVDGGGVRYFTEEQPGSWAIAVEAGNWAAWRRIAESLLATPEPQR